MVDYQGQNGANRSGAGEREGKIGHFGVAGGDTSQHRAVIVMR